MPPDASDTGQILIVEDRAAHAVLLRKALEKGGYRLLFAENGARVFYILERDLPDLILLDLVLPDMEGYEICERLKADPRTRHIPVIFISAMTRSRDKVKGFAAGGADFITKPFHHEEVLGRVRIHLALRKYQQSLVEKNADLQREIAERQKAEAALRASEERYRSFVENFNGIAFRGDVNFRPEFYHGAVEKITGYTSEDFMTGKIRGADLIYEEDAARVRADVRHVIENPRGSHQREYRIVRKDGRIAWIGESIQLLFDESGKVKGAQGTKYDITERKLAEEALEKHRNHLERLVEERTYELAAANAQLRQEIEVRKVAEAQKALDEQRLSALWKLSLMSHAPVKEIADYVLENIVSLTGSRVGFLGFIDADNGAMVLHAWSRETMRQCAIKDKTLHFSLKNAGIWADAVRTGRTIMINDYSAPHDGKKGYPEGHVLMHRFLSVPVLDGDRIVMAASVANKSDNYDGGDVRQITLLADAMWQLIRRKEAEDALKKRNKQLEILMRIGDKITSELKLAPLLQSISLRCLELFNGLSAGIAFHREDRDMLEVVASAGDAIHAVGDFVSADDDFIGEIFKRRESLILTDYTSWEKRTSKYPPMMITSIMGAPLCWGDEPIGVIIVRGNRPGAFSPEDGDLLFMLGASAAVAIRNAQLFDQIRNDAETKAELLKEVNHRVGNNLASISGLLSLERDHLENEHQASYRSIMEDLSNRVNALAKVHAMLSSSQWAPLNLVEMAEKVTRSSLSSLPARERVSVVVAPSPVRVSAKQAHNMALIINELTTNTAKYAANADASVCIFISVAADDGHIRLEFRDDGPGYPDAVLRLESCNVGISLALQLTRRTLLGSFILENRPGATAVIEFPAESE